MVGGKRTFGGVELDVKRSTDRNQAGTPRSYQVGPRGRPSAGVAGFLGVCVVEDGGFRFLLSLF